ncbi:MAG: LysM peptidoglycan-binding domain-containing protein [Treponema sp.]|nr:LysM peptidoglycan-binding domain-containing protein [Treponema sp.]
MMNRGIALLIVMVVFGIGMVFAQSELPEPVFIGPVPTERNESSFDSGLWLPGFNDVASYLWKFEIEDDSESSVLTPIAAFADAAHSDASQGIPQNIRNNTYFIESVRLTNLAQESLEDGDYDESTRYAAEAIRYARLSDEYVALQLKIKETDDALASAKNRLDWAVSIDALWRYPAEYRQAQALYERAQIARSSENWNGAMDSARQVMTTLASLQEAPPPASVMVEVAAPPPVRPVVENTPPILPARYIVRPWNVSKDCFWNIAGRSWAYGDPSKWRILYNANKAKLPQPDNPNVLPPGTILDIPSIQGEVRQGMWDAQLTYTPIR